MRSAPVQHIVSCTNAFNPKMNGKGGRKKNGSGYLNKSAVFPFHNPILMGGVSGCKFPLSAQLLAISLEFKRCKFSPSIGLKFLNRDRELYFNLCSELLKQREGNGFVHEDINPCKPQIVINEREDIVRAQFISDRATNV